ncbi:hypothetical protein ACQ86G_11990 [Roseateles chitinivorans]|uniref:hypothetical protein n=1 Tax=Roseateles chitinivorans TaxID=2917965 RepID=UPI003D6735CA
MIPGFRKVVLATTFITLASSFGLACAEFDPKVCFEKCMERVKDREKCEYVCQYKK